MPDTLPGCDRKLSHARTRQYMNGLHNSTQTSTKYNDHISETDRFRSIKFKQRAWTQNVK